MSPPREDPVWAGALPDLDATEALGRRLAGWLRPGDVVLLDGPLGAGKTSLVRALVGALGGEPGEVCSPTFTLLETYDVARGGIRRVHHADLYRLRDHPAAPLDEVGLGDSLDDADAVVAIEWPDAWPTLDAAVSGRVIHVRLAYAGDGRCAEVGSNEVISA